MYVVTTGTETIAKLNNYYYYIIFNDYEQIGKQGPLYKENEDALNKQQPYSLVGF